MPTIIQAAVKTAIDNLILSFQKYPDLFLTEEDMRCQLVSLMLKNKRLSKLTTTANGTKSIPIHTEVRWYGQSGKLKYRSDIVILNTRNLKTKRPFQLPSKGYGFDEFYAVIELKFRRLNNRSNPKFIKMIDYDFERYRELRRELRGVQADYYIICFDKKSNIDSYLLKYKNDQIIKFKYVWKQS